MPRRKREARAKARARPASAAISTALAVIPHLKRALAALFIFALPLLIYLGNTEYGYTKSIFALFVVSSLLVLWALEMVLRKDYRLNLTPLLLPSAGLLLAGLLSMINATSPGTALQSLGQLFYFFAFYMFIANSVEREWEIELLLGVILGSAFLASVYGILQYFGVLPGAPGVPRGPLAIISTMGNKNYLGGFLACLVVPALMLALRLRNWPLRALSLFALAVVIYTLVLIESDGAWLALGLSGAFFLAGFLYSRLYRAIKLRKGWLAIGAAGLFTLLALSSSSVQVGPSPASGPASSASPEAAGPSLESTLAIPVIDQLIKLWQRNSGRVRAWDWWVGWEMLKAHPLLGAGIGHYKIQFLPYKAQFLATARGKHYKFYIQRAAQAHNEYVQVAAEMGGLGILAGALALVMIFATGLRLLRRAEAKAKFIALALLAGVVASLTDALVSFPFHLPASALAFVLLLGLLNSRYFLDRVPVPTLTRVRELRIAPRASLTILALVLMLGVTVTTLAYRDWVADTHLDRGEQALKRGKIQEAKEQLEKSLALDFAPASALYWLGSIYHQLGDQKGDRAFLDQGRALLERSLASFPVEPTYFRLAQVYLNLGEFDRAMEYVDKLLATLPGPEQVLDARYLAAVIVWQRGESQEALRRLDELTAQQKDYERAYITRAKIYLEQGSSGLARLDLEAALKIANTKSGKNLDRKRWLEEHPQYATAEEYAQVVSEITRLEEEKKAIERLLQELPQ